LGINENYYTDALILLIKIMLFSKFHYPKVSNWSHFHMKSGVPVCGGVAAAQKPGRYSSEPYTLNITRHPRPLGLSVWRSVALDGGDDFFTRQLLETPGPYFA
jgi:hypothetical protein